MDAFSKLQEDTSSNSDDNSEDQQSGSTTRAASPPRAAITPDSSICSAASTCDNSPLKPCSSSSSPLEQQVAKMKIEIQKKDALIEKLKKRTPGQAQMNL